MKISRESRFFVFNYVFLYLSVTSIICYLLFPQTGFPIRVKCECECPDRVTIQFRSAAIFTDTVCRRQWSQVYTSWG